jgi:tetratricopeptide (TPR) repeat protein
MTRRSTRLLPVTCLPGLFLVLALLGTGPHRGVAQEGTVRATPIPPSVPAAPAPGADAATMDDRLRFANLLYTHQNYDQAAAKYVEFLNALPKSPESPEAWFRLGDCYRRLGRNDDAIQCLGRYLADDPNGKFAAVAAFSLARIHFNADRFAQSVPYWETAAAKLEEPEIRAETKFFHAQALQLSKRFPEAIAGYEELLASKIDHRYREPAELELARLALNQGDRAKALRHFGNLAAKAKQPEIAEEARFRAGILAMETKDHATAEQFLRQTLDGSTNPSYKQLAQMALMQRAVEAKDHDEVIRLYSIAPLTGQGKARAQLELQVANALRQKKNLAQAIKIYGQVERDFKGTPEGSEAGYRKLVCFHEAGDTALARYIDQFIAYQSTVDASSSYIDVALLLKGETLFAKGDYKGAAEAYRHVRPENVDAKYAPARLYKMGWAMTDSGSEEEGLDALGEFISRYPKDPLIPSALMKRAVTLHRLENYEGALKDYERIAKEFPDGENAEYAMIQVALIQRHLRRLEPMVAAYQALLTRFPKTAIRAEALYWIGGGLFDLKRYAECLEPLREARTLAPDQFGENASIRAIFAQFHLEDVPGLLQETRAFRAAYGEKNVLKPIYGHLGRAYYDRKEFLVAEPYLSLYSTPDQPKQTPPDVWRKLADVHLQLKKFDTALSDLNHYLLHDHHVEHRAKAILDQATCHLNLGAPDQALAAAEEVLRLVRAGRLNNEARLIIGDIHLSRNDPVKAIQFYTIVVEFGADPVLVPRAMAKLVTALEAKGDADRASSLRQRLAAEFPDFRP